MIARMPFLRRCWSCNAVIGSRDRVCGRCGARQRDPKRMRPLSGKV
jgi:predicted amidophosphoribosyltransferase